MNIPGSGPQNPRSMSTCCQFSRLMLARACVQAGILGGLNGEVGSTKRSCPALPLASEGPVPAASQQITVTLRVIGSLGPDPLCPDSVDLAVPDLDDPACDVLDDPACDVLNGPDCDGLNGGRGG
jgi:hypothetical protein